MRTPLDELRALDDASLCRHLRVIGTPQGPEIVIEGKTLLNFSSNDYLGLANDPEIKAAFVEGIEKFGAGSGASRLICGTQAPHIALEDALSDFMRTEAALSFATGYATALGTITALVGKHDIVIADKLCHASLIDAARLSGATLRVFPHNHLDKLESHLKWAAGKTADGARILVATESIFSMDGDRARLREIVELKDRHGALLILDEAHAFGILGEHGRGLADETGLSEQIDIHMGTLGKAGGVGGGFVASSRAFIDLLINRARSFIYSTAPPAAQAAAARKALERIGSERGDALRERLWQNIGQLSAALGGEAASAIIPRIIGSEANALGVSAKLLRDGFLIPAIRYPTVARGTARLRITVSAAHTEIQIRKLADRLSQCPAST